MNADVIVNSTQLILMNFLILVSEYSRLYYNVYNIIATNCILIVSRVRNKIFDIRLKYIIFGVCNVINYNTCNLITCASETRKRANNLIIEFKKKN